MKSSTATAIVRAVCGVMPLVSALGATTAAWAQTPTSKIVPLGPPGLPASAFPKPKRPVAHISASEWSTEEARDRDGEAEQVMNFLGVRPGMTVADIGAGGGYYTVRLARRIGPTGRVIGQDVMPEFLDKLRLRVDHEHLTNVTLALGEPHDPRLLPRSVDLVLMAHMYHEVEQPYGLLYNLLPALRDGARVAVIELNRPTENSRHPSCVVVVRISHARLSPDSLGLDARQP